jgi:D-xylose transport system ATP-binding protein
VALLEARNLTKRFAGVTALRSVGFKLEQGEIHALCGENGAGKSTLIKLLSGIYPYGSYEGELRVNEAKVEFESVRDAEAVGIAVITQEFSLIDELSVAENIFLGRLPKIGIRVDWAKLHEDVVILLQSFDLNIKPETLVCELGVGQKQLIEIIRAIDKHTGILVLDEPTAALADNEIKILINHLKRLKEAGTSCIYISHKLDEVFEVADRITILRDGESITTADTVKTSIPEVIRAMVGRQIGDLYPKRSSQRLGEVIMSVDNLSAANTKNDELVLKNITFQVRAGEVLGIGGLMGAGRTSLLMHLFGVWGVRCSGRLLINKKCLDDNNTPSDLIKHGLVLVSEDRRRYGLVLDQAIGFNLSLSSLSQFVSFGKLDLVKEYETNQVMFDALRIKAVDQTHRVGELSGGNQQKVVIGKALMTEPQVILFDEPTRGIDVGAKLEVYELINRLTDQGKAVVLVSSELPELMGMSDRIMMMHAGTLSGEFSRSSFTQEKLLAAAMGQS